METKNVFYRIIYAENLNYADENFKTPEEAKERNKNRPNDGGKIFRVTEYLEPVE